MTESSEVLVGPPYRGKVSGTSYLQVNQTLGGPSPPGWGGGGGGGGGVGVVSGLWNRTESKDTGPSQRKPHPRALENGPFVW